MKKEEAAKNKG